MVPKFYYNDKFRLGTLSGSTDTLLNPVERIADGDVGLYYLATSGDPPVGVMELRMPSGVDNWVGGSHLVIGKSSNLNGYKVTLESELLDGSGTSTRSVETVADDVYSLVDVIAGAATRPVWRLTVSGTSGLEPLQLYEVMLADEQEMPRSNEVGVERTRVRQFTRLPMPGGVPFTKRDGPRLRRTVYEFVVTSGAEVDGLEQFVDGIEGGEFFYHIDDRGEEYMAELMKQGDGQVFRDSAGVFSVRMTVLEVASD